MPLKALCNLSPALLDPVFWILSPLLQLFDPSWSHCSSNKPIKSHIRVTVPSACPRYLPGSYPLESQAPALM